MNTGTLNTVIVMEDLKRIAPSIFAEGKRNGLSDNRYHFVPTYKVVEALGSEGWLPSKAQQVNVRSEDRYGFQKHVIRFRNVNNPALVVGDSVIELILTNSHDGFSSFLFMLGLMRLVCLNGMVVSQGNFESVRIRHSSWDTKRIIPIIKQVMKTAPRISTNVNEMRKIELKPAQQVAFAESAKLLRWDEDEEVNTEDLLHVRRRDDMGNDLWSTFNRIQENITKKGIRVTKRDDGKVKIKHAKEIKSIDSNIRLNQALWTLAEKMKEIA